MNECMTNAEPSEVTGVEGITEQIEDDANVESAAHVRSEGGRTKT